MHNVYMLCIHLAVRDEPMNTVRGAVICLIRLLSHDSLDGTESVSSRDLDRSRNGCEESNLHAVQSTEENHRSQKM